MRFVCLQQCGYVHLSLVYGTHINHLIYREQAVTGHLYTITENKGQQDRSRQTKHSYSTSYYNSSEYNQGQSPHTHTHTQSQLAEQQPFL